MAMGETVGIVPTYDVNGGAEGFGGGGSWIWIILFILLLGNNNGGGIFGGGNSAVQQTLSNDFLFSNLNGSVNGIASAVTSGFTNMGNGLSTLGYESLSHFKDLSTQMSLASCDTNRNIDAIRFEAARNTCDIIAANEKNTDRILERLTQSEIQSLRDSLNTANLQISQQAQSASLINQLRPSPIPAYVTASPYEALLGGC